MKKQQILILEKNVEISSFGCDFWTNYQQTKTLNKDGPNTNDSWKPADQRRRVESNKDLCEDAKLKHKSLKIRLIKSTCAQIQKDSLSEPLQI